MGSVLFLRRAGLLKVAALEQQYVNNIKCLTSWPSKKPSLLSVFCVNPRKNRPALVYTNNMSQNTHNGTTEKSEFGLSSSFKFEHPDDYSYKPSESRRPSTAENVKEIIGLLKEILAFNDKQHSSLVVEVRVF